MRSGARPAPRRRRSGREALRRALPLPLLLVALLATIVPAAIGQGSEPETLEAQVQAATHAAIHAAQQAEKAVRKAAERESAKAQREARHAANRNAHRQSREAIRLAAKEKEGNVVTIDCSKVSVAYHGFPSIPGKPNTVMEWIAIKNPPESISKGPIYFPPVTFSFEGAEGTSTVPIAFPVGHYTIDVHAKWATNEAHGNFDIHGNVTCAPAPNFTIQKLQSIAGSGLEPTESPLSGVVGQTVDYTILVTNTGNTPLTFSTLNDPRCDAGTVKGGSSTPVEPMGTIDFTCTHKLTAADASAGSYPNTASVMGQPEEKEGPSKTKESNTVVVTPIATPPPPEEPEPETKKEPETSKEPSKEGSKEGGGNEPKTSSTSTPTPGGGVLSSPPLSKEKSGVLGFSSATIPALRGPQGCVRGPFVASIKSAGVGTVVFYLDGHKLKTLTSKNARKGLLSVRIEAAKLRVGAHHLLARITMKKATATATAAKAARSLTIVRCKSAVLTPHFTG